MSVELRPYQEKGIRDLYEAIKKGCHRPLWVFATGAGKSTVCSRFVKACVKNEKRVLFFVHQRELVNQFAARLRDQFHISSGIIMAGVPSRRDFKVQVASVQTLVRRLHKLPPADVIIIDEAHRSKAKTYIQVLDRYPDAIVVGLTATPFRGDGSGLGDIFDGIVHPIKMREMIKYGYLVGTEDSIYGPQDESVDLTGVSIVRGDYDSNEMAARFADRGIILGVVENYRRNAMGKKLIAFSVNVELSQRLCEEFNSAGIPAVHIDGATPIPERNRVMNEFAKGKYRILCNVGIAVEGLDVKGCDGVILNVSTKSLGRYVQMVGRGTRPEVCPACYMPRTSPDMLEPEIKCNCGHEFSSPEYKKECIVLDHGNNWVEHGFAEDYDAVPFSLEGVKKTKKKKEEEEEEEEPKTKICPNCDLVQSFFKPICKGCGYEFPREIREIRFSESNQFIAYDKDAMIVQRLMNLDYVKAFGDNGKRRITVPLSQLRIFALLRGYKESWCVYRAIQLKYVDVDMDHPQAYRQCIFLMQAAEIAAGTDTLYKMLKEQATVGVKAIAI